MSRFFKPYEGKRPFLFISYAHLQSEAVVETIRILHEEGWRLWYDEGIPAGSDWPLNIAQHMQSCERVVFFLSVRAMESANCYSEMRTATRQGKPVLVVCVEDAPVDDRWRELLEGKHVVPLLETAEERAAAILASGFVPRRFHRSPAEKLPRQTIGFAASLLFFLAAAGAFAALATGRWNPAPQPEIPATAVEAATPAPTPKPVVDIGEAEKFFAISFPDAQQERAIRQALSKPDGEIYRWQVAEIPALYFCGNMVTGSLEGVRFDPDGTCRVNGAPVIMGQVRDLRLLENAVRLEELALICQPLDNLSSLNNHLLLRELSLAGSPVSDLSALADLPSLETLHLEHTAVRDLTPLESLPGLKAVTVSLDMLPLKWSSGAGFRVILIPDSETR